MVLDPNKMVAAHFHSCPLLLQMVLLLKEWIRDGFGPGRLVCLLAEKNHMGQSSFMKQSSLGLGRYVPLQVCHQYFSNGA